MAEAAYSTAAIFSHPQRTILTEAVRGWEGEVNDLRDLSAISSTLAESFLTAAKPEISPAQARQMTFIIYELDNKLQAFLDAYYKAIEAH